MDIIEINKLIDSVNRIFRQFLKNGLEYNDAISRLFDEFDMNDSSEDLIVNIAIGEILINQTTISKGSIKCIDKAFKEYQKILEQFKKNLTKKEFSNISFRINNILENLSISLLVELILYVTIWYIFT